MLHPDCVDICGGAGVGETSPIINSIRLSSSKGVAVPKDGSFNCPGPGVSDCTWVFCVSCLSHLLLSAAVLLRDFHSSQKHQ